MRGETSQWLEKYGILYYDIGPSASLTDLATNAEWLNQQSVIALKGLKNLKTLHLRNPEHWTVERENLMVTQLPHTKVYFSSNPNVGFSAVARNS